MCDCCMSASNMTKSCSPDKFINSGIIIPYGSPCIIQDRLFYLTVNNKPLMTGHKGNSKFCFPETLNVPRGEAEGTIEVEGKQNSLFPEGPVIKCFVIPPDSKIEKAPKKLFD